MTEYKRPESVLVLIYARTGRVLLLKRADHPDFWQSVTGSMHWDETDPRDTVLRELQEETGLRIEPVALQDMGLTWTYPILPLWRARYAPEILENTERVFAVELAAEVTPVLCAREHTEFGWFSFDEAHAKTWSRSNRDSLSELRRRKGF